MGNSFEKEVQIGIIEYLRNRLNRNVEFDLHDTVLEYKIKLDAEWDKIYEEFEMGKYYPEADLFRLYR